MSTPTLQSQRKREKHQYEAQHATTPTSWPFRFPHSCNRKIYTIYEHKDGSRTWSQSPLLAEQQTPSQLFLLRFYPSIEPSSPLPHSSSIPCIRIASEESIYRGRYCLEFALYTIPVTVCLFPISAFSLSPTTYLPYLRAYTLHVRHLPAFLIRPTPPPLLPPMHACAPRRLQPHQHPHLRCTRITHHESKKKTKDSFSGPSLVRHSYRKSAPNPMDTG